MATAAVERPTSTAKASRVGFIIFGILIALLIVLNAVYFLFLQQSGNVLNATQAVPGGRVLEAISLNEHQAVALTSDNRFVLLEDGKVLREQKLDKTVIAMSLSRDGTRLVGGTSDRDVIVWDNQLNELSRFQVNGRVTSLRMTEKDEILVSHGIGRFTGRFWVSKFDLQGNNIFQTQVGQDVAVVVPSKDRSIFGLVNGDIGALKPDGKNAWRTKTVKPLLQLDVTADGRIIGADERGMVYLIDPANGKALWSQKLSEYKMRMVAYDALADKVVAGDEDGTLYMLEMDGSLFYQTTASTSPLRSFIHVTADDLYAISANGEWININLGLALDSGRQTRTNTLWGVGSALLVVAAFATLVATLPTLRKPALRIGRQIKESRVAYMLIFPSMALTIVFAYIPTVMGLYYSFTNFNLAVPIKFIGLDNFVKLSTDPFFWTGVGNMMLILITSLIKELTIPLLIAELIFWLRMTRLKYWLRVAYIIPSIVPGVVGILLWKQIYDPQIGLINEILKVVGLGHMTRAWLADAGTAIWAIIFAGFPWVSIFAFLIYFGGLLNINREIFDAAEIDGASAWRRFLQIDLKMIQPQLRLILFFTFLGSVQGYGGIWIMTRGGPGTATYVPGLQMFLQISAAEFGYASAIGFVLAIVVLVVTLLRFRFNSTPDSA